MTVVWLIIWLLSDHPEVTFVPSLNGWAVWLVVSLFLDFIGKC